MKALPQWVCWASHRHPRNNDKIPLDTNNYIQSRNEFAASDYQSEDIWHTYDEAKRLSLEHGEIDGIGFVIQEYNVCYIDIDNCVDPDTMEISDEVRSIIEDVNSYAEISVSGEGIHIICNGDLQSYGWNSPDHSVEISAFDGSWIAVTERHIEGTPVELKNCPEDLEELCERYNFGTYGGW